MALSVHALAGQHLRTRLRETAGPLAGIDFAALIDGQAAVPNGERGALVSQPHLDPLQGPTTPHVDPLENLRAPHLDPLEGLMKAHIDPLETLRKPHVDPLDRFATTPIDPAKGPLKPHVDPVEGVTMPHVDPPLGEDKTEERYITAMREALMRFTSMSALLRLGQSI
jgi:hypothetical protein